MMRWQTNLNKASVITKCTIKRLHLLVAKKSTVCISRPTDFTKQRISLIFFSWIDLLLRKLNKLFNLKGKFLSKKKFSIPRGLPKSIIHKAAITSN